MPNAKIDVPALHGGISQQSTNLRHFHQVSDAKNVLFTLGDGASKRPGSKLLKAIEGLDAATDYGMHVIDRDGSEQYAVIYGPDGEIRAFDVTTGDEVPVTVSDDAAAYLSQSDAEATDLRLSTVADFTFILNTLVASGTLDSAAYEIEREHKDYDRMLRSTPSLESYHKTREATEAYPAGWWLYDPGDNATFCVIEANDVSGATYGDASNYADDITTIRFHFTHPDTGDEDYEASVNFNDYALVDMHDVARALQDALQAAGATDALIEWRYTGTNAGNFYVTSPYRGSGASAPSTMFEHVSGTDYVNGTGRPFNTSGSTTTDGTGDPDTATLAVHKRWSRVAGPGQEDAKPDPDKMPVQMVRSVAPHYAEAVIDGSPNLYVRLGDDSGSTVTAEVGANGTYFNAPTLGVDGLLTGDTDTAVEFDGVDQYARVPQTLGDISTEDGLRVEALFKTSSGSAQTITSCGNGLSGTAQRADLIVTSNGEVRITFETSTQSVTLTSPGQGYDDGEAHHVIAQYDRGNDHAKLYIDGELVAEDAAAGLTGWGDFDYDVIIGAAFNGDPDSVSAFGHFDGVIDEVSWYNTVATEAEIDRHYLLASQNAGFVVDTVAWDSRLSGTDDLNPAPSILRNQSRIADISFHRNRLVIAGDENVVMSQAGDFFNFYVDDAENITDADPIDVALSTDEVTLVDFIVPFRRSLVIFTKAGRQFELSSPEALTADTVAITPTTAYPTTSTRPVVLGHQLYFASQREKHAQLYEYFYDDVAVSLTAAEVTAHVTRLLPRTVRRLAGSPGNNSVAMLCGDDGDDLRDVYVYRYFWRQNDRVQSAWSRWTFDRTVVDAGVIRDNLIMLTRSAGGDYLLEQVSVDLAAADDGFPNPVHLDRQVKMTGEYDAGNDRTTWDYVIDDDGIDHVVLGDDFGGDAGKVLGPSGHPDGYSVAAEITRVDDHTIRAPGDWSDGEVIVGRNYDFEIEPSRPWIRDRNNNAVITGYMTIRRMDILVNRTGTLIVRSASDHTADRTKIYTRSSPLEEHRIAVHLGGNIDRHTLTLENPGPLPTIVTAMEYAVSFSTRTR